MNLLYKPDFDAVERRFDAWWACDVAGRPLVSMVFPKSPAERIPPPDKRHASLRDRWLDAEFVVETACAEMHNQVFFADALPVFWPNLGPDVFASFYGCELTFGEGTSWSQPAMADWSSETLTNLRLNRDSPYYRKILELTDALIEAGKGRFLVGYTDIHSGGDAIAALRGPERLCLDLHERSEDVRALVRRITDDFLALYDLYHTRLAAAGMPSTTWLPALCRGRYHIPSNDFSCMIPTAMFDDIFLPEIVRECRHMDRCIYHLDGPQALRYLDLLLDVPEIRAIQWVPGAGRDRWQDWVEVYRRIQDAGRGIWLFAPVAEIDSVFEALRPEGLWLLVTGVQDRETAARALRHLERVRPGRRRRVST